VAAFLGRYALEDRLEEEVNAPGWSEKFMARLSRAYDEDMEAIARIPGVRLITP
jgi:hypothetical protein